MRLMQKIYDTLRGGADGPPPLPPLHADRTPPTPVRTRMGTPADVALLLDAHAKRTGRGGPWRESLGALLAAVDVVDSAERRDELAEDLNVDVSDANPAEAEAMLHAALIQRLADNDALAPQDFYK